MGDEIVNLLINLGIEVDEKGNIKKSTKDLAELQNILKKLSSSKAGTTTQLNKALSSAFPDEAKIKKLEARINSLNNLLAQTRKQISAIKNPPIEKAGITPEQLKAANNVSSPINLPSTAKLINTQQVYDKNGNLSTIKVYQDVVEKDGQKLVKTYKEINGKVVSETEKLVNNTLPKTANSKGSINKFVNRVKNIVVYRLVRTVMSAIGKSITEGLNLIAVNNSGAREILTDFKSATTSLSVSISTMLLPIMQSLSSMLNNISERFIEVANSISRQNALAQGQATYYRINKKAVDDYAKSLTALSGNLSQLDKFATLSGNNNPILGEFVDISTEVEDATVDFTSFTFLIKGLSVVLKLLGGILKLVGKNFDLVFGVVTALASSYGIAKLINLFNVLNASQLKVWGSLSLILGGFSIIAAAIKSDYAPAIKVLIGALGGLAVSFGVIVALKEILSKGAKIGLLSIGAIAGGVATFALSMGKTADSGSSATSSGLASAANINSLMSGVATSGGYSQSSIVTNGTNNSVGDVYLDNYKVGQVVAQGAYSSGVKSGFYR